MTTTICDICKEKIDFNKITIEIRDGEHPHNGSTMYKTIDCCARCASKLTYLKCDREFEEVKISNY
jgi:hypothetical protein